MPTHIQFLGIAAFRIILPDDRVILIDPCLDSNQVSPVRVADLERVDLLLVTHLAVDHLGEAAAVAQRFGCPVVCGPEVKYFLKCQSVADGQFRTLPWHGQVNPLGIRIRSIPSMHASIRLAPDGQFLSGAPMGFMIYVDDETRIYHSGDTAIFSDLKLVGELYRPTVGLICACEMESEYLESLGLHDHYGNEMSGDEGALAAIWLGLDVAVCCHFLNPEGRADVAAFVKVLKSRAAEGRAPRPVVLRPGEVLHYPLI